MIEATVAIIDDHELLAETVSLALGSSSIGCIRVAPQPSEELQRELLRLAPRLVLLDLDLGAFGDGAAVIRPLVNAGIDVLLLTGVTDPIRLALALEQGAVGVQPKAAGFEALVQAARAVLVTGGAPDPAATSDLRHQLAMHRARTAAEWRPFEALTERERQALLELADGRTVQEIAARWVVSQTTVRSHVQAILTKLEVASQLQAVVKAINTGWLAEAGTAEERAS